MLTWVEGSWTWLQSAWSERSPVERFAVVAVTALVCGAAFSAGWTTGTSAPWAFAAVAALAMLGVLLSIVARSSNEAAVDRQPARRADEGPRRCGDIHDLVLRRVGLELHDGPAQLISVALLRLDGLLPGETASDGDRPHDDLERIRGALQEALAEIRSMSTGLILPELSCASPADVLRLAARNHERRTATGVACDVEGLPEHVPGPIKSCLYRFAQEALNNAYRHAGGRGQAMRARCCGETMEVEISDAGPGFEPDGTTLGSHLGLLGMRERIASLGGTLEIDARPGSGTRLTTRFKLRSLQR